MPPEAFQPSLSLQTSQSQSQQLQQGMVLRQEQKMGLEILQKNTLELQHEILQRLAQNPMLAEVSGPTAVVCESDLPESPKNHAEELRREREWDGDGAEYRDDLLRADTENAVEARTPSQETTGDAASGNESDFLRSMDETWEGGRLCSETNWDADADKRRQHFFESITRQEGLTEQLSRQCQQRSEWPPRIRAICQDLCLAIDSRGYLEGTDEELMASTGATKEELAQAIRRLQSLEPAGIGARSLRECLLLQLERERLKGSLEWEILHDYSDLLEKNRLPEIARKMDCDLDEIQEALQRIRKLEPFPGEDLYCPTAPAMLPDVYLEQNAKGDWLIRSNRDALSTIALDAENVARLKELEEAAVRGEKGAARQEAREARDFLRRNLVDATDFIHAIDLRQRTVERVAELLLRFQPEFFRTGRLSDLRPLTQGDVARELGRAESTISRAVKGKCLSTPWGIFEFGKFFSSAKFRSEDGTQDVSSQRIQQRIQEMVKGEDRRKPLSDQAISDMLAKEGFAVARRTVAKYRDILKIPSTSQRREHA